MTASQARANFYRIVEEIVELRRLGYRSENRYLVFQALPPYSWLRAVSLESAGQSS